MKYFYIGIALFWSLLFLLLMCVDNNPWPENEDTDRTLHVAYALQFKNQDPATSFYSHESRTLFLICETPTRFTFYKRPYELEAGLLSEIPTPYEKDSLYITPLTLRPGLLYQPHPCFHSEYHHLSENDMANIHAPSDFPIRPTREVRAIDLKVAILRLADPRLASPVYPNYAMFIAGLGALQDTFRQILQKDPSAIIDYTQLDVPGIRVLSDTQLLLISESPYPQTRLWLALFSSAPIPQECLDFYAQPCLQVRDITMNTYPIGCGPYYMKRYTPNSRIILARNPNYDASKRNAPPPYPDAIVFKYEPEQFSEWTQFQQGYYDLYTVSNDLSDQIFSFGNDGAMNLSDNLCSKGVTLDSEQMPRVSYFVFNMQDPVIGGLSESQCAVRRAISIAFNFEEYLKIFANNQGIIASGVLPQNAGIFGARNDFNPHTHFRDPVSGTVRRLPIDSARQLLREAGYPGGIDPRTQMPLRLYIDHANGTAGFRDTLTWFRQQLAQIGIELHERPSDLNRFREKMDRGTFQCAFMGWGVAYPDPEDLLGLYYGPNSKALTRGRNLSNYANPTFDRYFKGMETRPNDAIRQAYIDSAMTLLRHDAPAVWCFYPAISTLVQPWIKGYKPHALTHCTTQLCFIDSERRKSLRAQWNRPARIPFAGFCLAGCALMFLLTFYLNKRLNDAI